VSEHETEGGMTFDQAAAAIESAGQQEAQESAATAAEMRPEPTPAPDQAVTPPTPGDEAPQDEFVSPPAEESFMGGDFNPDLLPDELKPGFKQLQGAWTQKTQELAEQRKAIEELGDPDGLRQAKEFYESLQDPEYLKNFYQELGGVVQELGLVEAPAVEPAAQEPVAPPPLPPELQSVIESDPELAPVVSRLAETQQQMEQFMAQYSQERQELEQERKLMAEAQEIDRMVQVVREEHPDYGDDDWQAIYDRAHAFDGNVLEAAKRYAADQDRIIQSYLSRKQQAPAAPAPGAGTVSEAVEPEHLTMDEADRAAQAYLDANDLTEFTG
jgi:hypothetical protein